jgi:hypothetical protein
VAPWSLAALPLRRPPPTRGGTGTQDVMPRGRFLRLQAAELLCAGGASIWAMCCGWTGPAASTTDRDLWLLSRSTSHFNQVGP